MVRFEFLKLSLQRVGPLLSLPACATLQLQPHQVLLIHTLGLLLVLQALLPLPLQLLRQAPAFFVQKHQAGLLFAQILLLLAMLG